MLKLMGKKMFTIVCSKIVFVKTCVMHIGLVPKYHEMAVLLSIFPLSSAMKHAICTCSKGDEAL